MNILDTINEYKASRLDRKKQRLLKDMLLNQVTAAFAKAEAEFSNADSLSLQIKKEWLVITGPFLMDLLEDFRASGLSTNFRDSTLSVWKIHYRKSIDIPFKFDHGDKDG